MDLMRSSAALSEPVRVPTGRVIVQGVTQRVCLVAHADGQEHCAAEVPVGGYDVQLYTEGGGTVAAGVVEIEEGKTRTLRCDEAFLTCY